MGNLQATDTKKNEITTIVLKSTNPYLPDRVEFKHQFVKFEAGHAIYIKKENVLTLSIWWKGGYVRFDHTQGEFTDMWTLSENLRSDVETARYVYKQNCSKTLNNIFFCTCLPLWLELCFRTNIGEF